jgi:hypothetical protein
MLGKREIRRVAQKIESLEEIEKGEPPRFAQESEELAREAEIIRLRFMQSHQNRIFLSLTFGLLCGLAGAAWFGWYFIVNGDFLRAVWGLMGFLPSLLLFSWARAPLKHYKRAHKEIFMPRMAKILGGFRYSAKGAVRADILKTSGVLPPYNRSQSEDCFAGRYKGIKIVFSEVQLLKGGRPVFGGIIALLELPRDILTGRVIITADKKMAADYAGTRWKSLSRVPVKMPNSDWNRFDVFSSKPDEGIAIVGERLLKELSETADIFKKSPLTASFFNGRFVLLTIPSDEDMFEASDMQEPLPCAANASSRRREVGKILEIMDVFEIYAAVK